VNAGYGQADQKNPPMKAQGLHEIRSHETRIIKEICVSSSRPVGGAEYATISRQPSIQRFSLMDPMEEGNTQREARKSAVSSQWQSSEI